MLNAGKSEVLLVGTDHMLHTVACPCVAIIAEAAVECKRTITLLGVSFDGSLSMDRFANSEVNSVMYHLCALRQIRPCLSLQLDNDIGRAIVLPRLDYCNSLLVGSSQQVFNKLQRLQNNSGQNSGKLDEAHPCTGLVGVASLAACT